MAIKALGEGKRGRISRWAKLAWIGALLVAAAWGGGVGATEGGSGWHQAQFGGQPVAVVEAHPWKSDELAAVVSGRLKLSHDGGISWADSMLPLVARAVAYDPARSGRLFAGTDAGLYVSDNNGLGWRLYEDTATAHKLVVAVIVTPEYVFAAVYDGAGTPVRVVRLTDTGLDNDTNLPSGNAAGFAYDSSLNRLYVAAAGGVYVSEDSGVSWRQCGVGAGRFATKVAVESGALWELSADGLYRSTNSGSSWSLLATPGSLNSTNYGSDMHLSGLAVGGDRAWYGAWSFGFPYNFLAEYSGSAANSVVSDLRISDLANSGRAVWAASNNGLWSQSLSPLAPVVHRPVLIIPGILGSLPTTAALAGYLRHVSTGWWDQSDQSPLALDPVTHVYDDLISQLEEHGYVEGKTLFEFPYNWTQDNAVSAAQLEQRLAAIRRSCSCQQVDIIAHSMGGLIARSYIQSPQYNGDVRNLIEVATPNAGSLDAYKTWEGGELGLTPNFSSRLVNAFVTALAQDTSSQLRAEFVRSQLPSVGQLLPIFNYISGRNYPINYPRNRFLEQLNQPANAAKLKQRVALFEVGGSGYPTEQQLVVGPPAATGLWPDGRTLGISYGQGDGTVLTSSLEVLGRSSASFAADHGQVVTAAAPFILHTLLGGYFPQAGRGAALPPQVLVYTSPDLELSINDHSGTLIDDAHIGVPGAYYTGLVKGLGARLALLPATPQHYLLRVKATEPGRYVLGAIKLDASDPEGETAAQFKASIGSGDSLEYELDASSGRLTELDSLTSHPPKPRPAQIEAKAGTLPFPAKTGYIQAMTKSAVWLGAGIGGIIGGWIPSLWGADWLSPWSLILSTVGGILGIILIYKLYRSL